MYLTISKMQYHYIVNLYTFIHILIQLICPYRGTFWDTNLENQKSRKHEDDQERNEFFKDDKKITKMHYFSLFFKKDNEPCFNFRAFGGKYKVLGNFEKTLKILIKIH